MTQKRERPSTRHSERGAELHGETNLAIVPAIRPDSKAFASLQAAFALRGHWLEQMEDGSYLVSHHRYSQSFTQADEIYRFLQQIGGAT